MKVLALTVLLMAAGTLAAQSAPLSPLLDAQLGVACPDAHQLQWTADGLSFTTPVDKKAATVACLTKALQHVDPYPVNVGSLTEATSVHFDGKLITLR